MLPHRYQATVERAAGWLRQRWDDFLWTPPAPLPWVPGLSELGVSDSDSFNGDEIFGERRGSRDDVKKGIAEATSVSAASKSQGKTAVGTDPRPLGRNKAKQKDEDGEMRGREKRKSSPEATHLWKIKKEESSTNTERSRSSDTKRVNDMVMGMFGPTLGARLGASEPNRGRSPKQRGRSRERHEHMREVSKLRVSTSESTKRRKHEMTRKQRLAMMEADINASKPLVFGKVPKKLQQRAAPLKEPERLRKLTNETELTPQKPRENETSGRASRRWRARSPLDSDDELMFAMPKGEQQAHNK